MMRVSSAYRDSMHDRIAPAGCTAPHDIKNPCGKLARDVEASLTEISIANPYVLSCIRLNLTHLLMHFQLQSLD